MKIRRLKATFGKIDNSELRLEDGLNIIEGVNESGKSTWCAFIRAMLYGINTSEKDRAGFVADKNKYRPWSGKAMEGLMDIEFGGHDITLMRLDGGRSGPMKKFSATFTGTADKIDELSGEDAGEKLTGVPLHVFERSAFIKQAGMSVNQAPELEKRVASLLSSGEEEISYSEADAQLRKWLRERKYNKKGLLPKVEEELEEAKRAIEDCESANVRFGELYSEIERLEGVKKEFEDEFELYQRRDRADGRAILSEAKSKNKELTQRVEQLQQFLGKEGEIPEREAASGRELEAQLRVAENRLQDSCARTMAQEEVIAELDKNLGGSVIAGKDVKKIKEQAEKAVKNNETAKISLTIRKIAAVILIAGAIACALLLPKDAVVYAGCAVVLIAGILLFAVKPGKKGNSDLHGFDKAEDLLTAVLSYEKSEQDIGRARDELEALKIEQEKAQAALEEAQRQIIEAAKRFDSSIDDAEKAVQLLEKAEKAYDELEILEPQREAAKNFYMAIAGKNYGNETELSENVPKSRYSRAEVISGLRYAEKELLTLKTAYGEAKNQLKTIGDPVVLEAEVERLTEERRELTEEYEALTLAVDVLKEADETLRAQFAPLLSKAASETMETITGGKYSALVFDKELNALAEEKDGVVLREGKVLSAGTVDQLYFALRLAICDFVLPQDEPCPLILDDALLTFDDERLALALNHLRMVAEKRQVILFTCQNRESTYFKNTPGVNIIKI